MPRTLRSPLLGSTHNNNTTKTKNPNGHVSVPASELATEKLVKAQNREGIYRKAARKGNRPFCAENNG